MARRRSAAPDPAPASLPTGDEKTARVRAMFDTIAPRYDLMNRLMTFGLDQAWRRGTVAALALPEGAVVLDLACGTGDLSRLGLRRGYRVVGADLSAGMLAANGAPTPLVEADGSRLPFTAGAFDGLVCGYALRNFTDLAATLAECARVLRAGGRLAVLEVDAPTARLWRAGYDVWFNKAVPALGGALSDREAYRYLPRSVAYLPPAAELRRLLREAGFSAVGIRPLAGGLSQQIVATRAGAP
jgi:demethylmenaquinone methyltransferase/2-methoxy-6-polyprenyl-1,4-benzoquinol methylase